MREPPGAEAKAVGVGGGGGMQDPLLSDPQQPPQPPTHLHPSLPDPQPGEPQGCQARGRICSDRRRSGASGTRRQCGARNGARGTRGSARDAGSAGTKACRRRDPRRTGPGLTPRRHTLSSRIAIMCSGSGRAGTQQHRPGRSAPSLRPAVSQSSRRPRGGTAEAAISGPRPPLSVTCRRPAPPDASSLA